MKKEVNGEVLVIGKLLLWGKHGFHSSDKFYGSYFQIVLFRGEESGVLSIHFLSLNV